MWPHLMLVMSKLGPACSVMRASRCHRINRQTWEGRRSVLGHRRFLNPFRAAFALSVEELRVVGDWAFERGGYTITLTPKVGGEAIQDVGKYITIYERRPDGSWLISRDIWNSDNPLFGK